MEDKKAKAEAKDAKAQKAEETKAVTTKAKDETKQKLSGKDKSRVEIAKAAYLKAQAKADAAKKRWEDAVEAEKANAGKKEEKRRKAAESAAKALERAGMPDEAAKVRAKAGLSA